MHEKYSVETVSEILSEEKFSKEDIKTIEATISNLSDQEIETLARYIEDETDSDFLQKAKMDHASSIILVTSLGRTMACATMLVCFFSGFLCFHHLRENCRTSSYEEIAV